MGRERIRLQQVQPQHSQQPTRQNPPQETISKIGGLSLFQRQVLDMQRTYGNAATIRTIIATKKEKKPAVDPQVEQSELAHKIAQDYLSFGGITVAFYVTQSKEAKVKAAFEFKGQGEQYAQDHGAIGLAGSQIKLGKAVALDNTVGHYLASIRAGIKKLMTESPPAPYSDEFINKLGDVPIKTLAIFTHGEPWGIQAKKGGKWFDRGSDMQKWAAEMATYLSPNANVALYACSTSGQPAKGVPFAQGLQEALEQELKKTYGDKAGPTVWGHSSAGHTTYNRNLKGFGPGAGEGEILSQLGQLMAQEAIQGAKVDTVTDADFEKLKKQATSIMMNIFSPVKSIKQVPKKDKDGKPVLDAKGKPVTEKVVSYYNLPTDTRNVYFREIPQLGLMRVWNDLAGDKEPSDYTDIGLTDEASKRAKEGALVFRKAFQEQMPKFTDALAKSHPQPATATP